MSKTARRVANVRSDVCAQYCLNRVFAGGFMDKAKVPRFIYKQAHSEGIDQFVQMHELTSFNRHTCSYLNITDSTWASANLRLTRLHYENTPIQIYWKFHLQKLKVSDKNPDSFHISAQNKDCGYPIEPSHRLTLKHYIYTSRNKRI